MRMSIVEYIEHHPIIALVVGAAHIAVAEVMPEMQIPLIVMQSLQAGAWVITILVGSITVFGWVSRIIKRIKNKKNGDTTK